MPEGLEQAPVRDVVTHPFRAQQGYEEYGSQAGLMATRQIQGLMEDVNEGTITEEQRNIYNAYAFPVISAFVEYGYNSRALSTAVITAKDARALMDEALGSEHMGVIAEAPLEVRLALLKTAQNAFIWGRTDDPHADIRLGEASEPAETPAQDVFFEEDIYNFANVVGDRVEGATLRVLKEDLGLLGRLALRFKLRGYGKSQFKGREFLQAVVHGVARKEAEQLLQKPAQE